MDTNTRTTCEDPGGDLLAALTGPQTPAQAARARSGRPGPKSLLDQVRRRGRRPERIPVLPAGLDHLAPPMRLDTDPDWQPPDGADHSLGAYDRRGLPIPAEPPERWARAVAEAQTDSRLARTVLFRAGAQMTVSTVFLGVDMAGWRDDSPPVLWETMIFAGATLRDPVFCRRYASQAAAFFGHALIVYAVRVLREAERGPARVRAQTPGARPWRHTRRTGRRPA